MMNTTVLDADQLLGLNLTQFETLLAKNTDHWQTNYRRLLTRWHPDHNTHPQATAVFIHLRQLYDRIQNPAPTLHFVFENEHGKTFQIHYQEQEAFELGVVYRGEHQLVYHFKPEYRDLVKDPEHFLAHLPFQNEAMKKQMQSLLPQIKAIHWGEQGGIWVIKKDPHLIRLTDLIKHLNAPLDPKHVAWILSGLYHLGCYLNFANRVHQAIDVRSVWIEPIKHEVVLLGGWYFSQSKGQAIGVLPRFASDVAGAKYRDQKQALPHLDHALIARVGKTLLGDASGQRLFADTPTSMIEALRLASNEGALALYQRWKQALLASFGKPNYVPMTITSTDIYRR
jgi:hypothetical protein